MEIVNNAIDKLEYLNRIKISIGVDKDLNNSYQEVQVYNLDGSTTTTEMTLNDIIYLTERGTITIPPRNLLQRIQDKIVYEMAEIIPQIFDNILVRHWEEIEIRNYFRQFNQRINDVLIPLAITETISSTSVISGLLSEEMDQHYLFDLKKLKNFLKSEIFFTN